MAASKMMNHDCFFQEVRMLQRKTRCSNFVCNEFVRTFQKFAPPDAVKKSIHRFDTKAKRAAGSNYIVLHGCPGCNRHVYLPQDKQKRCPFIKEDGTICGHPRFDSKGQALEVIFCFATRAVVICLVHIFYLFIYLLFDLFYILLTAYSYLKSIVLIVQRAFYFSIRERLRAFLRISGFRDLLEHERLRPRAENIMTDTYDSPAWKNFMGEPTYPCSRIGLQGCTDGFQAHVSGCLSLKPFMLANFSLPPALRFQTQFMFLMMLLPVNVKGYGFKKYFDFAASFELNSLYHTGESGIKVKIFSLSMDTPGRHELLGA